MAHLPDGTVTPGVRVVIIVQTFVAGLPRTKGSLAKRPNGTLYDSVTDSGRWRALMAGAVRDSYEVHWVRANGPTSDGPPPHPGPVEVGATFQLPVDPLAYGAGDLDKLTRNLLDALGTHSRNPRYNGGAIVDDNQVVSLVVVKVGPRPAPGVHIRVTALGDLGR